MSSNWAVEHLQVIRTLMERSAVYRRALAPIMLLLGGLGLGASALGYFYPVTENGFTAYWLVVSIIGICLSLLMVRRQAFREAEPFWSPPTRRVAQAALPAIFVGLAVSVFSVLTAGFPSYLPAIWMALYGCALNAAGFFMPRGMKLFGWLFIAAGCLSGVYLRAKGGIPIPSAHWMMGSTFGALHLAYGSYLLFTEPKQNEA